MGLRGLLGLTVDGIKPDQLATVAVAGAVVVAAVLGYKLLTKSAAAVADGVGAVVDAGAAAAGEVWHQAYDPGGAVGTVVGAAGSTVGLPTPSQTLDDPAHVRYLIDREGWYTASKWGTAWALLNAMNMPEGSGTMPPANTPAAKALGYSTGTNWAAYPIDYGTGSGW